MNLAMDDATITDIMGYGAAAASLLLPAVPASASVDGPTPEANHFDFDQHRWVRFRVLMNLLERNLHRLTIPFPNETTYQALFDAQKHAREAGAEWFLPADDAWWDVAKQHIQALMTLTQVWAYDSPELDMNNLCASVHDERSDRAFALDNLDATLRVTPPV